MDKKEIIDYLHNKLIENGADNVVVGLEGGKKTQVKFANNNIVATQTWDAMSIGIFASFKKKIVFTNLDDINKESADNKIQHILKFVKTLTPNENFKGIYPGPFKYEKIQNCYDTKIEDLSVKSVDLVQAGIEQRNNVPSVEYNRHLPFEPFFRYSDKYCFDFLDTGEINLEDFLK